MPNLPPPVWAELFYGGAWNDITGDVRVTTSPVTITRGLTSESASAAEPTSCTCDLDSRDARYAPRNPMSPLYGLIGRNTPFRVGYTAGSPWAQMANTGPLRTPYSPALAVANLDLRIDVALENWEQNQDLACRYSITGNQRSWAFLLAGTGQLYLIWSPDGTSDNRIDKLSTQPVVGYHGQRMALRVTLDVDTGSGYELRFYTGRTVDDEEWNLLGDPITATAPTSIYNGTSSLDLGTIDGLTSPGLTGKLYAFKLLDGINGPVIASMTTADASPGAASFTSGGVVWTASGGTALTNRHIRMAGEVPAWPPTRDLSGADNYVSINPSGILRRMDAGNKPQESCLRRFIMSRNPVDCWPLTDGAESTGAASLTGGTDLIQVIDPASDTAAEWASGTLADWIEPVLSIKPDTVGRIEGRVRHPASTDSHWSIDFFISGGDRRAAGVFNVYDRGAGTDSDNQTWFGMLFHGYEDTLTILRHTVTSEETSIAPLSSISTAGIYTTRPHHVRLTIEPSSAGTEWWVYIDGVERDSGVISGVKVKALRTVQFGWGYLSIAGANMSERALGYITYWDASGPTAAETYRAFMGSQGERAGDRITRLATESGYVASVAGEPEFQQRMGVQGQKKILELMNDAARTDFGYLLDARDRTEVIHRGQSTLWNQPPGLILDFEAGLISPPFKPVDDDKLTENDVSVRREFGQLPAREVLEDGELSVRDPEDGGVGRYDSAYTYSVQTDAQARQVAGMRLHLGTYAGVRYTRITLNLANERVFQHIDDILRLDVGDKLRLTNLPPDHGPDDVDVLVVGYTEEAGPDAWTITFTCVPGEPWTAGVVGSSTYGHVDTDGSELAAAVTATATEVSVAVTDGPLWTADATDPPWDIRVGGEVMTVTTVGRVINSNAFFTADTTGWSEVNAAISRDTSVLPPDVDAVAALLIIPNGTASFGGANSDMTAPGTITPGADYDLIMWCRFEDGWSDVRAAIDWHDEAGGFLSSSLGSAVSVPAGEWALLKRTVTAPASASRAVLRARHGGTPPSSAIWRAWGFRLVPVASYSASPQTMTVTRSVNGVRKSHSAGTDVRLAHPVYVAM